MTKQTALAPRSETSLRRFVFNVGSNLALIALNMGVALWFTPYLIGVLGVAVYGVATLATSVATYMAIVDSALNKALGRYLTIEIRQERYEAANRTFNTALGMSLAISAVFLPIIGLVSFLSPRLFDTPVGQESATQWVFAAALLSYLLIIFRGVFTTSPFATNRLDLQNLVQATGIVIRVVATVLLLSLVIPPSVSMIGTGVLVGMLVSTFLAWLVMRRLTPQLKIDLRRFDRAQLAGLFGISSWVFVNEIGSLLSLNIDQIVVNVRLGAEVQGSYALALQWSVLLLTLGRAASSALAPMMMIQYAGGQIDKLAATSRQAVKYLGLAMALPVGLIVGFAPALLRVWVGPQFEPLSLVLAIIVFPLCVYSAVTPLFTIQIAYNRVRVPAFVSFATGLANLILALWWVGLGRLGLGVALASATALAFRFVIFTPYYSARIQSLPWYTYYPALLTIIGSAAGTALASRFLSQYWFLDRWLALLAACAAVGLVYVALVYVVALSAAEKRQVQSLLERYARRFG